MDISNYIDSAVLAVIAAVVSIAAKYAVSFLKAKHLTDFAYKLVSTAEATFAGAGQGTAKFSYVSDLLVKEAAKIGVKLNADQVKVYTEAALVDLKNALGIELQPAPSAQAPVQPATPVPGVVEATPAQTQTTAK